MSFGPAFTRGMPVIVKLAPRAAASADPSRELARYFVGETPVTVRARAMSGGASDLERASRDVSRTVLKVYPRLGLAFGFADRNSLAALRADRRVDRAEEASEWSLIKPVARTAVEPPSQVTWGLRRLNIPRAWQAGFTGKGVIVGHLDTGIERRHPALKGAVAAFAEFDDDGNRLKRALARDSEPDGHGTHTAGIIAGRRTRQHAIGVAPGCKLVSGLVIEGGDVVARVLAGMEWVVEKQAKILNLSLGLPGYTPAFEVVVDALWANDVLPVVAIGNEGANTSRSPGNYADALSIGAHDEDGRVAGFSSSRTMKRETTYGVPLLVAPGVDIISCVPPEPGTTTFGFAALDGTSMATPHIAGIAALLKQAVPTATARDLHAAILASCVRPSGMSKARANHGAPDAVRAFAHFGIAI